MIRLAKIKDLDNIMIVINDAKELFRLDGSDQWQDLDNYPNETTMLNDIKRNELYVYEENNNILGCVVLSSIPEVCYDNIKVGNWQTKGDYTVLHRIAVRKDSYNKGIGKALVNYTIEISKIKEVSAIKVDTKKENIRMLNLLKNCGFKEVGIIYLLRKDVLDKERIALEYVIA